MKRIDDKTKQEIIDTYNQFGYSTHRLSIMFNVSKGSVDWIIRKLTRKYNDKNYLSIYKNKDKKKNKEVKYNGILDLPRGLVSK